MSELLEILYCSVLSPSQPPLVVGQIVGQARAHNAQRSITGLLVFDGSRFCQHLEGPPHAVDTLMNRIAQDTRHLNVRVLYSGQRQERRYKRFDLGFAQSEDADDMAGVHELRGRQALDRFLALRSEFDVNG